MKVTGLIYKGRTTTLYTKDGCTMYLDSNCTQLAEPSSITHDTGDAGWIVLALFLGFLPFFLHFTK